jgi:predicted PurR-regulated permease PerM
MALMSEQILDFDVAAKEGPAPADVVAARGEIPLPSNPRSFLLTGIFLMLILYSLYFAREIVLPIMFAFLLKLLLTPIMRVMTRFHVPRILAAVLLVVGLCAGAGGLAYALVSPATEWLAKVPTVAPQLEKRFAALKKPMEQVQEASKQVEKITDSSGAGLPPQNVRIEKPGIADWLLSGTATFLTGLVTTVVMLFFLLIAGDLFLRRLVEILPKFSDKKQAVEISNEVERNISAYLLTITVMNALVGAATGLAMRFCGFEDALLWGVLAFLLNYIPLLGPAVAAGIFFIVGFVSYDEGLWALMPVILYLTIHFVEGEVVTPMLLARRFTLNPVLVIGSLVFWHFMWGVAGVLLAVPMLAVLKIVCDRVRPLMAVGHFIGGEGTRLVPTSERS